MRVIKRKTKSATFYILRNEKCYTHISNRTVNLFDGSSCVATDKEHVEEVKRIAGLMQEKILDIDSPIAEGDEIVEIFSKT